MSYWGFFFLFLGIACGVYAFQLDISVALDDGRIVNLGLMNDRHSLLAVSGILSIIGSVFLGADHVAETLKDLQSRNQVQPPPTHSNISSIGKPTSKQQQLIQQYDKGEISFEAFQSEWERLKG